MSAAAAAVCADIAFGLAPALLPPAPATTGLPKDADVPFGDVAA